MLFIKCASIRKNGECLNKGTVCTIQGALFMIAQKLSKQKLEHNKNKNRQDIKDEKKDITPGGT